MNALQRTDVPHRVPGTGHVIRKAAAQPVEVDIRPILHPDNEEGEE